MADEEINKPVDYEDVSDYERFKTSYDKILETEPEEETTTEKEAEQINEEYNKSGSLGIKNIFKKFGKTKGAIFVGILFLGIFASCIFGIKDILFTYWYLDTSYSKIPSGVALLLSALPFLIWMWSTKYAIYNFYKLKRLLFKLCVLHASILLWLIALKVELKLILPFIFLIPTYGGIKFSTVVLCCYLLLVLIFATPAVIATYKLFTIAKDEMTDRTITSFYISAHLPDTRKNKKFAYDAKYIKRMDSYAKMHVIQQGDRYLHTVGLGSTGTGKTAGIETVVFESDLAKKVFNTDYQKKIVEKYLKSGKARMTRYFEDIDFNIDYIEGAGEDAEKINKELQELKVMAASAGKTMFCPNAAYADELYQIAKAKKFRVNRVDPMPDERTGKIKDEWIGFNPLFVPLQDDQEEYIDKVFTAAKLYSDVNQAVFELSGKGDPYFTSLNRSISVADAVTLIITYPHVHPGRYATPEDVQRVVNNFDEIKPYRDKLIDLYGIKNEAGFCTKDIGKAKVGNGLQFILDRIDRDMLGPNAAKINDQATGLRNIIDDSLMNPKIRRILCSQETIDLDRVLENGEITLVNFEISLGSDSTGFGMFFLLSFIQAVLRRKGTRKTRIPHYCDIDEAPWLLHAKVETALTLFRQYCCGMTLFLQSLSQLDKNDTTRYLKQVMIGNCATQVWFGRSSSEEMKTVELLAGKGQEVQSSESMRETALSDEHTQLAKSTSYTVEENARYAATDVRYRQFLECTVMTVRNSTPLLPFVGKVNFLPESKLRPVKRYVVDWSKYYKEPESEVDELTPEVTATTEISAPAAEQTMPPKKKGILSAGSITSSTKLDDKEREKEMQEEKVQETPSAQTEKKMPFEEEENNVTERETENKETETKENESSVADEELFGFTMEELL